MQLLAVLISCSHLFQHFSAHLFGAELKCLPSERTQRNAHSKRKEQQDSALAVTIQWLLMIFFTLLLLFYFLFAPITFKLKLFGFNFPKCWVYGLQCIVVYLYRILCDRGSCRCTFSDVFPSLQTIVFPSSSISPSLNFFRYDFFF